MNNILNLGFLICALYEKGMVLYMKKFEHLAANYSNPNWNNIISRNDVLYKRENDFRSEFARDYNRVIYSTAYRRLKHKTQVFFSPENDHICTRIEHVTHVDSISYTIADYLGLNTELTKAIAVAHDIGHSPFGHEGERILSAISKRDLHCAFWHEKNGLDFVDNIELLENQDRFKENLNLTYGVRDGIISHCGEIDENGLRPRDEFIDLSTYTYPNEYNPYTWEACVVKIADKISYIGRDIEDAITLGILDNHLDDLNLILSSSTEQKLNNTFLINYLVSDLCKNSSPENGLSFSEEAFELLSKVKRFNYYNIYFCDRIKPSVRYFNVVLNEIYDTLKACFDFKDTVVHLKELSKISRTLSESFLHFVYQYYDCGNRDELGLKNKVIFDFNSEIDYCRCILYYISGMTDNFAMDVYREIIGF